MKKATELEICTWLKPRVYHDGENLRWLASHKKELRGTICGRKDRHGYWRINNARYGMVQVHRLIFFIAYGFLPKIVDHIDGVRDNNRIANLRGATLSENAINCKTSVKNTSGRKGVYKHGSGKWQASIRVNGTLHHLGIFENFDDAVTARTNGEEKYHGEFSRK